MPVETVQIRRKITKGNLLFGDYTLLHVIAQGRVGVICEAEHNSLKRIVALKMVNPEYAEKEGFTFTVIEAFLREARIMACIDHPNVVPIYHGGTIGQCPFISMRLVRGGDLGKRIAKHGHVSHDWALRLANECAAGLQAIHAAGYIHADLRPANILLEKDGMARITDFGVAIPREGPAIAGEVAGSPNYLAPEQRAGGAIDFRSDLYALGASLFYAATGEHPGLAETPESVLTAIHRAMNAAKGRDAGMCRGLAAITAKLLAQAPADRYAMAEEILHDCRQVAAGEDPDFALGKARGRKEFFFGWKKDDAPIDVGSDPFGE
ncbi:MAG: serine/threonine protein kinase [Planctomycetes bacterium]|nr:serine/threonine protein kinase [Planctomycetota bacterium]